MTAIQEPLPAAGLAKSSPTVLTLAFPPGYSPSPSLVFFQCGANMRKNRWAEAKITKQIRSDSAALARSQGLPQITQRVDVLGIQHPAPGKRTIDSENIAPLIKAAIDGLRDAGVLSNDSPKYVRTVAYTTGSRIPGSQLILRIALLEERAG